MIVSRSLHTRGFLTVSSLLLGWAGLLASAIQAQTQSLTAQNLTAQNLSAQEQTPARTLTWPAPAEEAVSKDYIVTVNGKAIDVYIARVNDAPFDKSDYGGPYSFVQFDFEGQARLEIRCPGRSLKNVVIQPAATKLQPRIKDDHTVELTLDKPVRIAFEPQGKKSPLLIFANRPEKDPIAGPADNIIYFGPGLHKPAGGVINLSSNQTLYLAGGAVVQAGVIARGNNIAIRGRGILDGNPWQWTKGPTGHLIDLQDNRQVRIEGIIIRGSWGWTIVPKNCADILIDNVKICNGRVQNDDGVNPCNSRRVTIRNCFIRTDDDCIALKGLQSEWGNVSDILVEDSLLWCDRARITLMGHESRAPRMGDIVFRNIDIPHFSMPVFLLEPGEEMKLEQVRFENIRIQAEGQDHLAVIRPAVNQYMKDKVPGHIRNITFKNIRLSGQTDRLQWVMEGLDDAHQTENVTLQKIIVGDKPLTRESSSLKVGKFTQAITVEP